MPLLADYLRQKILPWMNDNPQERFIVGRKRMQQAQMPPGVTLSRHSIKGERTIIKDRRYYGNIRTFSARYPDAGLVEMEVFKIVVILAGRARYRVNTSRIECGPGYFFIIPPGIPSSDGRHDPYNAPGTFCEALVFALYPHAVQCMLSRSETDQDYAYRENYLFQDERLVTLFRLTVEELVEQRLSFNAIGCSTWLAFWLALQREVEEEKFLNPGPIGRPVQSQSRNTDFTSELLSYIQPRLKQPLSLETVAKGMYLSRTQFIRRMRQETGKSFVQFLNDYRIEEAKKLLHDSDWSITAIAGFLGFKSPTYLQRVFRHSTTKTPTEYREWVRSKKVR